MIPCTDDNLSYTEIISLTAFNNQAVTEILKLLFPEILTLLAQHITQQLLKQSVHSEAQNKKFHILFLS
jgi:hypothetical protein